MKEMKMLGVRVPEGSSIPERLKKLSTETRLSYYELIERWLDREDREHELTTGGDNISPTHIEARLSALESQIAAARLDTLKDSILNGIEANISSVVAERVRDLLETAGSENKDKSETSVKVNVKKNQGDSRQIALKRARELKKLGKTGREIAEILNNEGIPALSGRGKWHHSSIQRLLNEG
jgi:hypothetical protein